jgi:hypothetical protein
MTQMELSIVFESENDKANHTPASISGDGGIELQFSVGAICARKFALNRAGKGFGAFGAEWRNDALGFIMT